jgi:hypothetical protein
MTIRRAGSVVIDKHSIIPHQAMDTGFTMTPLYSLLGQLGGASADVTKKSYLAILPKRNPDSSVIQPVA